MRSRITLTVLTMARTQMRVGRLYADLKTAPHHLQGRLHSAAMGAIVSVNIGKVRVHITEGLQNGFEVIDSSAAG
jgi:hypothetical protein